MMMKCPLCGRGADKKFQPFCSERCAQIDLGRWLGERYAIPAEEEPADIAEEGAASALNKP